MITTNWTPFNEYISPQASDLTKVLKNLGINSAHFEGATGYWRRAGHVMEIRCTYTNSSNGMHGLALPAGYTIDQSRMSGNSVAVQAVHDGITAYSQATVPILGW